MSTINQTACDRCGTRCDDIYAEQGWVIVNGSVCLTRGRGKDKAPRSGYLTTKQHEFCSLKCFSERMRELKP